MEIERKYVLESLPRKLKMIDSYIIEQLYISTEPEVRLRKKSKPDGTLVTCKLSYKGDGDIQREEIETDVGLEFFEEMKRAIGYNPIVKHYHRYELGNHILEASMVDGSWFYAEIEFDSVEEAKNFKLDLPDAFDVTYDSKFKMKNYWKRTRLKNVGANNGFFNSKL